MPFFLVRGIFRIRQIICSFMILSLLGASASLAQRALETAPEPVSIEELVRKAGSMRREYIEAFKDLNAEETQRVEEYDDKGLKRRRDIVSDLIVYQSALDAA